LDREMEKVRREAGAIQSEEGFREAPSPVRREIAATLSTTQPPATIQSHAETDRASADILALRDQLNALKQELAAARHEFESTAAELRRDLDVLNRQLGN